MTLKIVSDTKFQTKSICVLCLSCCFIENHIHPISDHNCQNPYPFSFQNSSKIILFGVAHTFIAYIGGGGKPLPTPSGVSTWWHFTKSCMCLARSKWQFDRVASHHLVIWSPVTVVSIGTVTSNQVMSLLPSVASALKQLHALVHPFLWHYCYKSRQKPMKLMSLH